MTIPWLDDDDPFPPVESALREPNGLIAAGGDLSPARLMNAYRHGIFPWFGDDDPVLWWTPDPRMVLWLSELHVSRSLRRALRSGRFTVTLDAAFDAVIRACAEPRAGEPGTWITAEMLRAYGQLAAQGHAHSVESWLDGKLVGGLYGVAVGRMFYGESMFSRVADGSKVALACLVRQLVRWQFELIDCQMSTTHLASLGAREIPRVEFMWHVTRLTAHSAEPARWSLDPDLVESVRVK
jgi:leucyl/phenylalanyl-tRNA---protein transferase